MSIVAVGAVAAGPRPAGEQLLLIIQHIWTKWTKRARGANSPLRRRRLAEAYPLPPETFDCAVLRHEVRAIESEEFAIVEQTGPTDRDSFARQWPHRHTALDWRLWTGEAEILVRKPSDYTQQTKWPAKLPNPLFVLKAGETARIEWNGRFAFGSNRSSYFEQHVYWLAIAAGPEPRLFLDAQPRKRIDYTTHIY